MARNENLPFPRGETYSGWASSVSAADVAGVLHLIGKEYVVEDEIHGKGEVTLRILQVGTAGAAAAAWTDGLKKNFATPASYGWLAYPTNACAWKSVGGSVDLSAGAASSGVACVVVDDYYAWKGRTQSIAANDLIYAIVKGPAKLLTNATPSNIDAGDKITSLVTGTLAKAVLKAAAVGDVLIGTAIGANIGSDAAETVDSKAFLTAWVAMGAIAHGGS